MTGTDAQALPHSLGPETEIEPPQGVRLEEPASGGVLVHVQLAGSARLILALPRLVLLGGVIAGVVYAWRHHVYVFAWILGLPFLRWLFVPGQSSLLIGERALRAVSRRWFGGVLNVAKPEIRAFDVTRGNALQGFQRVLSARLGNGRSLSLFAGLSAAQARFLNDGLQRWLAGEN